MNREILFRGKRTDNGEWFEGSYRFSRSAIRETTHITSGYGNLFCVIPETVGQFTGLTDNNGVKIFEGDIIKHNEKLFEIKYSTEQARYLATLPNGVFNPVAMQNCEVIGNIFDNPELLEGEENEV